MSKKFGGYYDGGEVIETESTEKQIVNRIKHLTDMVDSVPKKHAELLKQELERYSKDSLPVLIAEILDKKFEERLRRAEKTHSRKLVWDTEGKMRNAEGEEQFSICKMFRAIKSGDWSNAKFENDIIQKAMSEGTDTAGGFLVPEEWLTDIKDRITAIAVVRGMGPTTYPMASDTLNIPKITGGASANWIGENTTITATDATLAQLQLVAKKLAALVKLSTELMNDSNPKVEGVIRRDLAKVMALQEDIDFLRGSGAGAAPTGIINITGVAEVTNGANGATPTFDQMYDTLYEVELANGLASGWVMHPRTKNSLRKIKDTNEQYIYNVNPSVKEPDTLMGLPVKLTTQLPINLTVGTSDDCSEIIIGQWDEAVIGERGFLEFALDASGTAFEAYQTWIRAIAREDFGLRTAGVFCMQTGVRP